MSYFDQHSCLLLILAVTLPNHAQDNKTFPTNDEINLAVTQIDRAIRQYKPLIDQESTLMGKAGLEAAAKDGQVVQAKGGCEQAL